ncbi:kinase-like domain-containing protein [Aspergillus caelatus]|uniref:non-specific serine/threonine protein kinase n=1 Tax=Aspergillus caelatus TaxID=61420 RepID=A0A5N6ZID3_9EURO|nr:kinase-like domain-containing protein [Aspergillus caelatus]KAE8357148.1 kinase-like domain-containing protein [Aspergillus caelatus]
MSFQFPLQPSQNAIQGKELYNYFGNRVLESRASAGRVVAVKVKPTEGFARSEADMMHYASQKPGILAPQGESLDNVWHTMTKAERKSIKEQLKEQLRLFRQCTQPYIGRINRQETRNFYDRIHFHFMGPLRPKRSLKIWARLLPGMRGTGEQTFVLTHGDLAARNIMVKDGKIAGIVDWEYSGLFPEYMEYAMATVIHDCKEDWWKPHLKEILEPCGYKRAKFTAAIKWRGW